MASLAAALAPPPVRIGYVTDVEGNLDYFRRYVRASGVLRFDDDAETVLRFADDGCRFVFGGDAVDKGDGDVRLCRMLADLSDRYGRDRVALLVGNRDLNKLRYTAELSPEALATPPEAVPGPHWDDAAPRLADYLKSKSLDDSRANRLRWMLEHTLGCPGTFEFRRAELATLRNEEHVKDDDVVDSCVGEVLPGGALRAYLERASGAARFGSTLFGHGAVDAQTAGFVPDRNTRFRVGRRGDAGFPPTKSFMGERDVDAWVRDLNALLAWGLEDHLARPTFAADGSRGGDCLLALQNRCAVWGRSVVSNCYADGGNVDSSSASSRRARIWAAVREGAATGAYDARAFEASTKYTSDARDPQVHAWLRRSGVRRVVVGHRPVGDSPALLRAAVGGVEVVMADTSFADVAAPDKRGARLVVATCEGDDVDNALSEQFDDWLERHFWPTFEKFGVDGQTLLTFDWEDYLAIGVTQSHQIKKLLLDIERRAFYRTYKVRERSLSLLGTFAPLRRLPPPPRTSTRCTTRSTSSAPSTRCRRSTSRSSTRSTSTSLPRCSATSTSGRRASRSSRSV